MYMISEIKFINWFNVYCFCTILFEIRDSEKDGTSYIHST